MTHSVILHNPASLPDPTPLFTSQIAVSPPFSRIIFIAGQVPTTSNFNYVPPDFTSQLGLVLANIQTCLIETGATIRDLTSWTIYVVDYTAEREGILREGLRGFLQGMKGPPVVILPVIMLASPEWKVQISCTAAVSTGELGVISGDSLDLLAETIF